MTIQIQVQDGKLIITVGGQAESNATPDGVAEQSFVGARRAGKKGGDGPVEDAGTGGGGPSAGTVVIGPIVIDCCALQEGTGKTGGDGPVEDAGTGGGGPSSGAVVIGPIVIGGQSKGANVLSVGKEINPPQAKKEILK